MEAPAVCFAEAVIDAEEVADSHSCAAKSRCVPSPASACGGSWGKQAPPAPQLQRLSPIALPLHYSSSSTALSKLSEGDEEEEPHTPPAISPALQASVAAWQSATSLLQELQSTQQQPQLPGQLAAGQLAQVPVQQLSPGQQHHLPACQQMPALALATQHPQHHPPPPQQPLLPVTPLQHERQQQPVWVLQQGVLQQQQQGGSAGWEASSPERQLPPTTAASCPIPAAAAAPAAPAAGGRAAAAVGAGGAMHMHCQPFQAYQQHLPVVATSAAQPQPFF